MKRTLRRESKALEIAGREALGARRLRARRDARRGRRRAAAAPGACQSASGRARAFPHRPVHLGGTASVGSHGRQGGGVGPGGGGLLSVLRAASPAVALGAEEEEDPRPFGGQEGDAPAATVGRGPGTRRLFGRGRLATSLHP